ncbi:hypothetical protein ABN028_09535 [Actinopolymorpha sp. B17G11]|uniref:hypothetical protein n=1 Tax=Actinopolymorpha sp. B17G11 TaxID=3160861 RepID=UPI0032E3845B
MTDSTPNIPEDNQAYGFQAECAQEWVDEQVSHRAYRLMHVYENTRLAVDWMAEEIKAQQQIAALLGESEEGTAVMNDAASMLLTLASMRDHAAEVVSGICGETAFKTGEVHKIFYEALDAGSDSAA